MAVQRSRDTLVSTFRRTVATRRADTTWSHHISWKKRRQIIWKLTFAVPAPQRLCNMTSFLNLQDVSKDQGFNPRGKLITPGDAT
jgi:hypothetical protein